MHFLKMIWSGSELHRLEENLGALKIELTPSDLREIEDAASKIRIKGTGIQKITKDLRVDDLSFFW